MKARIGGLEDQTVSAKDQFSQLNLRHDNMTKQFQGEQQRLQKDNIRLATRVNDLSDDANIKEDTIQSKPLAPNRRTHAGPQKVRG